MIVKQINEIQETKLKEPDIKGVTRKILIGPDDDSLNIVMRLFRLEPGGYTYDHKHPFEHLVKVEKGIGVLVDEEGKENILKKDSVAFIKPGERHQFRNNSNEPFEFLCIILNQESSI